MPDPAAPDAPDRLIAALIPVGPQLAFLFRRPSPDAEAEIVARRSGLVGPIAFRARRRDARAAPGRPAHPARLDHHPRAGESAGAGRLSVR